jgi:phage antirepressor YoqD-like protein
MTFLDGADGPADASGAISVQEFANAMGMGRIDMHRKLRALGILDSPTKIAADWKGKGLLSVLRFRASGHPGGVPCSVWITPKGVQVIKKLIEDRWPGYRGLYSSH